MSRLYFLGFALQETEYYSPRGWILFPRECQKIHLLWHVMQIIFWVCIHCAKIVFEFLYSVCKICFLSFCIHCAKIVFGVFVFMCKIHFSKFVFIVQKSIFEFMVHIFRILPENEASISVNDEADHFKGINKVTSILCVLMNKINYSSLIFSGVCSLKASNTFVKG